MCEIKEYELPNIKASDKEKDKLYGSTTAVSEDKIFASTKLQDS